MATSKFTVEQELQICKKQADIYVKYYKPSLFTRSIDGIYLNPMDFDGGYKTCITQKHKNLKVSSSFNEEIPYCDFEKFNPHNHTVENQFQMCNDKLDIRMKKNQNIFNSNKYLSFVLNSYNHCLNGIEKPKSNQNTD